MKNWLEKQFRLSEFNTDIKTRTSGRPDNLCNYGIRTLQRFPTFWQVPAMTNIRR